MLRYHYKPLHYLLHFKSLELFKYLCGPSHHLLRNITPARGHSNKYAAIPASSLPRLPRNSASACSVPPGKKTWPTCRTVANPLTPVKYSFCITGKQKRTDMGGSQSVEIPGGGSEGYHVLRVRILWLWHAFQKVAVAVSISCDGLVLTA